jgi:hypothetical protein
VVDCFDALTSIVRIVQDCLMTLPSAYHDRRGTMYDPLVVDTFFKVLPELAKQCVEPPVETRHSKAQASGWPLPSQSACSASSSNTTSAAQMIF